ncbi:hypothetical protein NC652_034059 [Populus alba x Populus x berolinensis]|nr:hypothetical protein NC652_034059 [Populus alba x Populus x berolinensis]KAJ6973780.1 hypothetical protein NC653_033953 [Populus alba x Populus x berolinensis]
MFQIVDLSLTNIVGILKSRFILTYSIMIL